jgi:hypothetical protein
MLISARVRRRCLTLVCVAAAAVACQSSEDTADVGSGGQSGSGKAGAGAAGHGGAAGARPSGGGGGGAAGESGGAGGDVATAGAGGSPTAGAGGKSANDAGAPDAAAGGAPSGEFDPCPTGAACKVLTIGDGLVAGSGSSDGGGWRKYLFASAVKDGKKLTFVGDAASGPTMVSGMTFPRAHEGHAGADILAVSKLVSAAVTKHAPNVVILQAGSEDLFKNQDLAKAPDRLLAVVDSIAAAAPNAAIIVVGPPALDPGWNSVVSAQWNYKAYQFEKALTAGVATRINEKKMHLVVVRLWFFMAGMDASKIPENVKTTDFDKLYVSGLIWVWSDHPANLYDLNDKSQAPNLAPRGGYETAAGFIYPQLKRLLH